MDKTMLKYFKIIGQVQTAVANATTLKEALHKGLNTIIKECGVDYAVVWFEDAKGDSILHPYYWICPIDITSKARKNNEGIVGRVYKNQKSENYLTYKKGTDVCTDEDFKGIDIGSLICVPLSNKYDKLGCVEFIKKKDNGKFTQEDLDICEILSSLIAVGIDENVKLSVEDNKRKVILSARDITREFKNGDTISKVLKGVNLDVYEGEFLAILGESGCGKSTLLNIIGGLDKATSGSFTYMDKDMSEASEDELTKYRRENIGFIFQSYNLMPNLNAEQNLELIGELIDDPLDSIKTLEMVGMGQKGGSYPSQLSGGQQQRISIARSLVKKPKMIFADEPTAALDYETSIAVLNVLEKVVKKGTTMIMVTHNEEITRMADRVVRFRNGQVYEITVNKHPVHANELVW